MEDVRLILLFPSVPVLPPFAPPAGFAGLACLPPIVVCGCALEYCHFSRKCLTHDHHYDLKTTSYEADPAIHYILVELDYASKYCFDRAKTSDLGSLGQALSLKMWGQE